uniref:Olfactomedin-like domain-containing protein n=1 Tax=Ascaris lumbricoides TaxID=6252 RepID=A0A0M3HFJ4_ASCLU
GRLAAAVGDKLAALAAFNAAKDEVESQLSLIEASTQVLLDHDTVQGVSDRINELDGKLSTLEKLKNLLMSADEQLLDANSLEAKREVMVRMERMKQICKSGIAMNRCLGRGCSILWGQMLAPLPQARTSAARDPCFYDVTGGQDTKPLSLASRVKTKASFVLDQPQSLYYYLSSIEKPEAQSLRRYSKKIPMQGFLDVHRTFAGGEFPYLHKDFSKHPHAVAIKNTDSD